MNEKLYETWSGLREEIRKDIDCCLTIWSRIFEEIFEDQIEYAYVKGSSIKLWDSPIDYVPILSDVDVHVKLNSGEELIDNSKISFDKALEISKQYEEMFNAERPTNKHLPRMQIINIDRLVNLPDIDYVPPRMKDVQVIYGNPKRHPFPTTDRIRKIDAERTVNQKEFINSLHNRIWDRSGLDYWGVFRCGGIGWRVSPAPYRLVSQTHMDPLEVWGLNRTKICEELGNREYNTIERVYSEFYETCWTIYLSDFKDNNAFREMITLGYNILQSCLIEIEKKA